MMEPEKDTIMPVVIGALGSAYGSLTAHLSDISDDASARIVQKTVLSGTSRILQNLLS